MERHNNILKRRTVKRNIKFVLVILLSVYMLLYLLVLNGIYITNFNQSTSINIHLEQNAPNPAIAQRVPVVVNPIIKRVEGKDMFYVSAVVDQSVKYLPPESINSNAVVGYDDADNDYHNHADIERYLDDVIDPYVASDVLGVTEPLHGIITLNGWESFRAHRVTYHCFYEYKDKKVLNTQMVKKNIWDLTHLKILNAAQVVCPLLPRAKHGNQYEIPKRVALSHLKKCHAIKNCRLKFVNVLKKAIPPPGNNSIAICAKLIYNNYPAERLVEWFEFNKLMGVDKIMMFKYNVSEAASKVLDFYEADGILKTVQFDFPMRRVFARKPGGKNTIAFHDEQVTVFDCVERFHDYAFVSVLDIDEFLVPMKAPTWKDMLTDLQTQFPEAAGFSLHTQIFTLDWGVTNHTGDMFVTRYIQRTHSMWDRKKNIVMPSRVHRGSVWTHDFKPISPYISQRVMSQAAIIFHYRACRRHWVMFNTCLEKRRRIKDNTMVKIMSNISRRVKDVKSKVLVPNTS